MDGGQNVHQLTLNRETLTSHEINKFQAKMFGARYFQIKNILFKNIDLQVKESSTKQGALICEAFKVMSNISFKPIGSLHSTSCNSGACTYMFIIYGLFGRSHCAL